MKNETNKDKRTTHDRLFNPTFAEELALAHAVGKQRFGGICRHEATLYGRCTKCLRKVVSK